MLDSYDIWQECMVRETAKGIVLWLDILSIELYVVQASYAGCRLGLIYRSVFSSPSGHSGWLLNSKIPGYVPRYLDEAGNLGQEWIATRGFELNTSE